MTIRWMGSSVLPLVLLSTLVCSSIAQSPVPASSLPAAPAPAPKPLVLPPGSTTTVISSSGEAPPAPDEDEYCYAPAVGLYTPQPPLSAALREQVQRYIFRSSSRMETAWDRNMPWAANDAWSRGAVVVVRFAILPDGSTDTPIVTLTSGRKSYDQHALDSIRAATPFEPLPAGVTQPVPICMRFGYNANRERHRFKLTDDPPEPAAPAAPAPAP